MDDFLEYYKDIRMDCLGCDIPFLIFDDINIKFGEDGLCILCLVIRLYNIYDSILLQVLEKTLPTCHDTL